jgi:hypothetical protein
VIFASFVHRREGKRFHFLEELRKLGLRNQ